MGEMFWLGVVGLLVSTSSIIVTIVMTNRNMANQHRTEAEKLATRMVERVAVLEAKVNGFMDRVSHLERIVQNQIDDLKLRLFEIEKEMKREKSQR